MTNAKGYTDQGHAASTLVALMLMLVDEIEDTPKRILFRGVSRLHETFTELARTRSGPSVVMDTGEPRFTEDFERLVGHQGQLWVVTDTDRGSDFVGKRNDPRISVLVVFETDAVQERESLNAFRVYNDEELAKELVRRLNRTDLPGLEAYETQELDKLGELLDLVRPSAERLALYLLGGKEKVGDSLPLLGLFHDPALTYSLPRRQWVARLKENHEAAVLRWHDLINKGTGNQSGRAILGEARVAELRKTEVHPEAKETVLRHVTPTEALSVLNPPSRLVENLMRELLTRGQAEELVRAAKNSKDDLGARLAQYPQLSNVRRRELEKVASGVKVSTGVPRVQFVLEGLMLLARDDPKRLPRRFRVRRANVRAVPAHWAEVTIDGGVAVGMSAEAARALSSPDEKNTGELLFEVVSGETDEVLHRFTVEATPGWVENFKEDWLGRQDDPSFWDTAIGLDPQHEERWDRLRRCVEELQAVVDPEWTGTEEAGAEDSSGKNNALYAVFDLLYLAHREVFDRFLDAWLAAAVLRWQANNLAVKREEWHTAIRGLMRIGTSKEHEHERMLFPFYPLRFAWYREVLRQMEGWLSEAAREGRALVFDPSVLSQMVLPVDRPRVIFGNGGAYVEAASAGYFLAAYVAEGKRKQVHPPFHRARQKVDEFGVMWPFSLSRLHLAFQPDGAAHDVFRMLTKEANDKPDAAYQVEAVVRDPAVMTYFDRQLLGLEGDGVDLLREEHHESIVPRVDYVKSTVDTEDGYRGFEAATNGRRAHVALLVDPFRQQGFDFHQSIGRLNPKPQWQNFGSLVTEQPDAERSDLATVDFHARPFHFGPKTLDGQKHARDVVYVPMSGDRPEYLRMLHDSLQASQHDDSFQQSVYAERMEWDEERLRQLHDLADWVVILDRILDKSMFDPSDSTPAGAPGAAPAGPELMDFRGNLPGGYRMSVSSRRTDAVKWQLAQVLQRYFPQHQSQWDAVAGDILHTVRHFAGGLLLKTLGGGSLAQEMLGLYATYKSLVVDGEFIAGQDVLVALDDHQNWFGRRTQSGRRADLLVLRLADQNVLRMTAVESKWYNSDVHPAFVKDEFEEDGQMRTAVSSLYSLFDPTQLRIDKIHWQRVLASLLDGAPDCWDPFRKAMGGQQWRLEVDGVVHVHLYDNRDTGAVRVSGDKLNGLVQQAVSRSEDGARFSQGSSFRRLHLHSLQDIEGLFFVQTAWQPAAHGVD